MVADHDERILAIVSVVALANAKLHKTKRLIEVLRDFIAAANFQRRVCRTEVREVLQKPVRQAFSRPLSTAMLVMWLSSRMTHAPA